MRLVSTRCNNTAAQNFGDHLRGFAGAVHTVIGKLVRRETLRVKLAKAAFVAEEGPVGHGHAAREQNFNGRIKPEHRSPGGTEKFGAAGLRVGAAAEREDRTFFVLGSTAEGSTELVRLNLAERGFAEAFENLRDGEAGGLLNAFVEIDKAPGELPGQERTDGGLAGAHETSKAQNRDAGWKSARKRRSGHAREARKASRAVECELYHCRRRVRLSLGRRQNERRGPWCIQKSRA